MAETTKEQRSASINSKNMLKDLAKSGTKVKFSERLQCVILKDSGFYKKDQVINPHKVVGQA